MNIFIKLSLILVLSFFITTACDSFQKNKTIKLNDGRSIAFRVDREDQLETFVVSVPTTGVLKTKRAIEEDAVLVWNEVKTTADEFEIDEGLLVYSVVGVDGKERQILFTAEKIETGEWLVRSAN